MPSGGGARSPCPCCQCAPWLRRRDAGRPGPCIVGGSRHRCRSQLRGACQVDVRIGIVQSMKELDIELPDDAERDKVLADIEAALAEDGTILWLTDRKGRQVGVPVGKVAYVEVIHPAPTAGSASGSPDSTQYRRWVRRRSV